MENEDSVNLSFPKVWALGQPHIKELFKDRVEITEKVDGSQIGFGLFDGELFVRSKGVRGIQDDPPDMFKPAVEHIKANQHHLIPGAMYWAETLKDKKHNTLTYSRTPKGYLVLLAIEFPGRGFSPWERVKFEADNLGCEAVRLLYEGEWAKSVNDLKDFLEQESFLGGSKVEGIVVKNYNRDNMIGGQYVPFLAGKLVSEKFKEKHQTTWKKENTGKGKFEDLCESYRNENRWNKAVQHLAEAGKLENSPRDIGELIKEVKRDIQEEEKEEIKERLWKIFSEEIIRNSTKGFAEWYKEKLLEQQE